MWKPFLNCPSLAQIFEAVPGASALQSGKIARPGEAYKVRVWRVVARSLVWKVNGCCTSASFLESGSHLSTSEMAVIPFVLRQNCVHY